MFILQCYALETNLWMFLLPGHSFGGMIGVQLDQMAAWIELKCNWMVLTRERAAAYIGRTFTYSYKKE